MTKEISRRSFVGAGLVVAVCGAGISESAFALGAEALNAEELYAATYKLLGQQPANPFFASTVFSHIVDSYPVTSLNAFSTLVLRTPEADLANALKENALLGMATEIANVWYSGTVHGGTSAANVIGYVDNLSWQAIKFSTPQSVCGGHFGHWYKLPTGQ